METDCYGPHLTMLLSEVEKPENLFNENTLKNFLVELVHNIDMKVLSGPMSAIDDTSPERRGASAIILLVESHAAIHTYSDLNEVFLDIFSCKPFSPDAVTATLEKYFGKFHIKEYSLKDRGYHWHENLEISLKKWRERNK